MMNIKSKKKENTVNNSFRNKNTIFKIISKYPHLRSERAAKLIFKIKKLAFMDNGGDYRTTIIYFAIVLEYLN